MPIQTVGPPGSIRLVFEPCGMCNDGRSRGKLGSDGWFECPAGHTWKFPCPQKGCDKAVWLRDGKLICGRKHEYVQR